VIVDTPPTSVVSDAIPLINQVSGVIVVCRLSKTTRESAAHLRQQLENLDANTLGVVVNGVGRQSGYYGYGYGYAYGYGPSEQKKRRRDAEPVPLPAPERVGPAGTNGHAGADDRQERAPGPANGAPGHRSGVEPVDPTSGGRGGMRAFSRRLGGRD
jgi:hypothetical protein